MDIPEVRSLFGDLEEYHDALWHGFGRDHLVSCWILEVVVYLEQGLVTGTLLPSENACVDLLLVGSPAPAKLPVVICQDLEMVQMVIRRLLGGHSFAETSLVSVELYFWLR